MEPIKGKFDVEKFDGKGDFGLWKYKMLCQLEILGLDKCLVESKPESSEKDTDGKGVDAKPELLSEEKDRRCKNLICMSVNDTILRRSESNLLRWRYGKHWKVITRLRLCPTASI